MSDFGEVPQINSPEYTITGENYDTKDPNRPTVMLMMDPHPSMENAKINTQSVKIVLNNLSDPRIFFGRQPQEKPGININPSVISSDLKTNDYVSRLHGELNYEQYAQYGKWMWSDYSSNGSVIYQPEILEYDGNRLNYTEIGRTQKRPIPLKIRITQGTILKVADDLPGVKNSAVYLRFHSPNFETDIYKLPQPTTDENIIVVERVPNIDAPVSPELEKLLRRYSPTRVEPPQNL